mgnify:CR=1 FL=1
MAKKSFNQKLQDSKDLPKIAEITDLRAVSMYGGTRLLIAPPLAYDEIMKQVPEGKVITSDYTKKLFGEEARC